MHEIRKGDIVTRKSHNADMIFKVIDTLQGAEKGVSYAIAVLKGIDARLIASAPFSDLIKVDPREVERRKERLKEESGKRLRQIYRQRVMHNTTLGWRGTKQSLTFQEFPGTVLHLDGDEDYMKECLEYYSQMKIPVKSLFIGEREQPKVVRELLEEHRPDILILTGHDGLIASKKRSKT